MASLLKKRPFSGSSEKKQPDTPPIHPSPPPSYHENEFPAAELAAQIRKLDLTKQADSLNSSTLPTTDECIAHLKLLTAFAHLREEISRTDGLFGLSDSDVKSIPQFNTTSPSSVPAIAKMREKRWAVYVVRAVDRFQKWWETLIPGCGRDVQLNRIDCLNPGSLANRMKSQPALRWHSKMLPPLDVLMVLHSFMLNPRNFLEDSFRYGMLPLWNAGFPWELVNAAISNQSFDFTASAEAIMNFESKASSSWDNLSDPLSRPIKCSKCRTYFNHLYTESTFGPTVEKAFEVGRGYADKNFSCACPDCGLPVTHQSLCLTKFNTDLNNLLAIDAPMSGTILSLNGVPDSTHGWPVKDEVSFPNRLLVAGLHKSMKMMSDVTIYPKNEMQDIRVAFELGLQDRSFVAEAQNRLGSNARSLKRDEKIAIRRMMSRYWENSSPFALDLAGAVLRQGVFVDKMRNIDWIHSPAVENTMARLIIKYENFFKIIQANPGKVAVPTLDVDLAWHTHQLTPNAYFAYSVAHTAKGEFVDHDDKIDENVLSRSFEWTAKQYSKITNGDVYSECTCWYCEAIRESQFNSVSLFSSKKDKAFQAQALGLHDRKDISSDPSKNPHISAHSAVKAQSLAADRIAHAQAMKLDSDYLRAVKRAKKAGKTPPERDTYISTYVWGYPMYLPMGLYYPYGMDPCISYGGGMYGGNAGCMATNPGAIGNCAAGTCGGGVAAGSCGGSSGAGGCAGSAAGGGGGGFGVGGGCGGGSAGCGGAGGGCGGGGGGC